MPTEDPENPLMEDWSKSLDDMDSGAWEKQSGGPDDDAFEKFYKNESDETEPGDFEMEETDFEVFEEYHDSGSSRQKAIMAWLENSELARRFKNSNGFFVPKGSHVHLMDDSIVDLLNWLDAEGIKGGKTISNYSIVYTAPDGRDGEKLSFHKIIIVEAPFSPDIDDEPHDSAVHDPDRPPKLGKDDIPF
jgi:hypothetical protein